MLPKKSLSKLVESLNVAITNDQLLFEAKVFEECQKPVLRGNPVGVYLEKDRVILKFDVSGALIPKSPETATCLR